MKTTEKRITNKEGYLILPTIFTDKGWDFTQIAREANVAVYKKTKENIVSWETIIIKTHDGYKIADYVAPPSECYPPSESWGTLGFSLLTKQAALDKVPVLQKWLKTEHKQGKKK